MTTTHHSRFTIHSPSAWHARAEAHAARVEPWVAPRRERRSRGEKHPVDDFLWEYYAYRPATLARWHPGLGVALEDAPEFLAHPLYSATEDGAAFADPARLPERRREGIAWIAELLRATRDRAPHFGCFGLHEWAMVYRPADGIRHASWPLRMTEEELAKFVEAQGVRCSHFDAFRFFTPAAAPLNRLQPSRAAQPALDQRGCLHVNMDLYKWAQKLAPFAPSELAADCFALAREIRETDMRASPYDLQALGLEPIFLESAAGRAEYEARQRDFAARSQPLRLRLLAVAEATRPAG